MQQEEAIGDIHNELSLGHAEVRESGMHLVVRRERAFRQTDVGATEPERNGWKCLGEGAANVPRASVATQVREEVRGWERGEKDGGT